MVPRLNRGGGLVLFWKISINIEVVDSHKYFIDTIINGLRMHGDSLVFMESPKPTGGVKVGVN